MNDNLTNEEITILIESLDSWVHRNQSGELMGDLLTAMIDGKMTPEMKAERDQRRATMKREQQLDQDTATLLKAKLIRMRQRATIHA